MPLFSRPDGVIAGDVAPDRHIMPFVMKKRNGSCVYHDVTYDITKTRRWLRAYNRSNPESPATLFHLYMWAMSQAVYEYPQMNRFVSGGRIYQRERVEISFAAKKTFSPEAPLITVKVPFENGVPFPQAASRIASSISNGRRDSGRTIDRELKLASWLPVFLLRFVFWLLTLLDRWNLMPGSMIASDPMYATAFMANLGSVGLNDTYHHLYEYGTVSLFAVIGVPRKTLFVSRNGQPEVRDGLQVRWTMDERITDGYYAGVSLGRLKKTFEDPERYLGKAEEVAAVSGGAREAA